MNPWFLRIIILVIAIPLVPIIVNATTMFVTNVINSIGQGISSLVGPVMRGGSGSLQDVIKLALYLLAILALAKFFFGGRGGGQ